jgi:hypothetical protein
MVVVVVRWLRPGQLVVVVGLVRVTCSVPGVV